MEKRETLDAICERIKALEDEICALRLQNKRMRVVIAALVVIAVLPYLIAAGMQTQTFSVLRVERLEFVQDGELVASIAGVRVRGRGSGLGIYDEDDKPVIAIDSHTGGSNAGSRGIFLLDKEGNRAISLLTMSNGSNSVNVFNTKGKIVATLNSVSKDIPASYRDSGSLAICDANGDIRIGLGVGNEGNGGMSFVDRDGNIGVTISARDTGGRIEIARTPRVGNTKALAVAIGVDKNGSGFIGITNSLGLPLWSSPQW